MYTIGQVAEMFNLPASTLRYYDSEGLFPNLARSSGIRQFSDNELEALRVIDCLKKSGLAISEIKQFMDWSLEGPTTFKERYDLFVRQRAAVEAEIAEMEKVLNMIKYKQWYYATALEAGDESVPKSLTPEALPKDIQFSYAHSH